MPPGRSRRDVRVAIDDFSRRALRDGEQIVAALDDAPMIQHGHPVTVRSHTADMVGNEEKGHAGRTRQ